jgi:hypothetical protein
MGHPPRMKARLFLFFGEWSIKDADTEILGRVRARDRELSTVQILRFWTRFASRMTTREFQGRGSIRTSICRWWVLPGRSMAPRTNDDTRISRQGFHQHFDLEAVGGAGHVHRAEDERLGEGEGCFSLEF